VIADPGADKGSPDHANAPDESGAVRPEDSGQADAPRRSATYRFAPLLLVAGAIAAAITLIPHLPKERRLELRLDDVSSIVDVELSVASASNGEPVQGNAWHFSAGSAPASLSTAVNLPDGRYEVDITVQRTRGRQSVHHVIAVGDSEQIAIPVQ
jgi:hypothetical protein